MNRRQFTASLGAAVAAPLLPLPALARAAAPAAALQLPPAAYAWASLIARAQPTLSAAKLARFLRVDAFVARHLFSQLIADGILSAPSAIGTAQALKPMQVPHGPAPLTQALKQQAEKAAKALVKPDAPPLDCAPTPQTPQPQESAHASPDQHLQECPETG